MNEERGRGKEKVREGGGKGGGWKIVFWNIARK